jgi:hypothetical protein
MRRRRATLPTTSLQLAQPQLATTVELLTVGNRRRRAADRAWSLMVTSIPTREILASYLADVLTEP